MKNTVKFNTKAELAKALLDGRKFLTTQGDELYYDEKDVSFNSPFLVKNRHGSTDALNLMWVNLLDQVFLELLPEHPHQALMDLAKDNPRMEWQYRLESGIAWYNLDSNPTWVESNEYRPHPHWQLIIEAKDNPEQEWESLCPATKNWLGWVGVPKPVVFMEHCEYRKKQTTEVRYQYVYKTSCGKWQVHPNILTEKEALIKFKGRYYEKTGLTIEVPV